ncbi:MAG TPA: DUF4139 domain-containing protein, partial [Geobacteraceae bacterium]
QGKGAGQARIAGLTVRNVFLERLQEKHVRELEDEILALERKVESIDARRTSLAAQRAFVDSIRVGWGERISKELTLGKPTAAELGEALRFVGEGINKIEEQKYDAEVQKKPLADRIAALKKELEQARGERKKEVREVEVAIEASKEMSFNLELSYVIGQARWEPAYDVRLTPDGKSAELIYRAMVWQKTGEEWSGVTLSLSTARPEVGGAPPELQPWRVAFYEPPPPSPKYAKYGMARAGAMPAAAPLRMLEAKAAADEAEPEQEALPQSALVEEGQTSVLFTIPQPIDIPADGTRSGSVIALERVPVTAEYLTVPKLSPRVYLKSEVVNKTPYPLLAGTVNVFNDNTFTGKAQLKTVAAGEKFDIFFGADDQLKVKRDVARNKKEGGVFSGNRLSYRCTVELENFKKEGVTVSLLDQLPLPGNEEIKVSLDEAVPKPDELKANGTQVWKVALKPGEKRVVSYDIVIDYPKGREITGAE